MARARLAKMIWRPFCRAAVRVFFRRVEIQGLGHLPASGPVILCANHANSIADGVIVQAASPRTVHPLARSGLWDNPLLRPVLALTQAIPVYRRQDTDGDTDRNVEMFARCYEILAKGDTLLIFPEGMSHSEPRMQPLKTGAARIVLGARLRGLALPTVLPVGLCFTDKGRFRSGVLIQFGEPVRIDDPNRAPASAAGSVSVSSPTFAPEHAPTDPGARTTLGDPHPSQVRQATDAIDQGLQQVTLNLDSWRDMELFLGLERFFRFRRGRRPASASLSRRFRALRRLIRAHDRLRQKAPEDVALLRRQLLRFERMRRLYGVRDYQLTLTHTVPGLSRNVARRLAKVFLLLPLALWGLLNSTAPYLLTRAVAERTAAGPDQYGTMKISFGAFFFTLFWGTQTFAVWWYRGNLLAIVYAVSLPLAAPAALLLLEQRSRIMDEIRAFFLFRRRQDLQQYLLDRRAEIEAQLARLVKKGREVSRSQGRELPPSSQKRSSF